MGSDRTIRFGSSASVPKRRPAGGQEEQPWLVKSLTTALGFASADPVNRAQGTEGPHTGRSCGVRSSFSRCRRSRSTDWSVPASSFPFLTHCWSRSGPVLEMISAHSLPPSHGGRMAATLVTARINGKSRWGDTSGVCGQRSQRERDAQGTGAQRQLAGRFRSRPLLSARVTFARAPRRSWGLGLRVRIWG